MSKRANASRAGVADRIQPSDEGLRGAMRRLKRYGRGTVRTANPEKYLHRAERARRRQQAQSHE